MPMAVITSLFRLICICMNVVLLLSLAEPKTTEICKAEQAQGFTIFYGQEYKYKIVENFFSNTGYILLEEIPSRNNTHCTAKLKSFTAPFANYSVDNTKVPEFLQLLGVLDNLKGVTSECTSSACLMKYIAAGDVQQIHQEDPEQILQFSAFLTSSSVAKQKCNYINVDPFKELKPLQRAEWIKFVAALMDYEGRANTIFKMVEENYLCLSALAMNASTKPTVAWMAFDKDTWSFSNTTYKLQYVLDAGGSNLDDSVYINTFNMSSPSDVESFHCILSGLDIAIDESYAAVPSNYTLSTFIENALVSENDNFSFVANQNVWRYDKQIGSSCTISNDWFDGAVSQPQIVLGDLIQALHPQTNYTTIFLRNIAKGDEIMPASSDKCTHNISSPLEPTLVPCNGLLIG
ncbi:uncharacterized protein LOC131069044 isoform X2 [Cryptomeria japonica]|uniref:uncharacterized protein LOC131069044 isoform X2 n=1 Tax=Cryptomeria japonica TaxID=3369 RepID=UPI0025ABBBC2|nr:uncharacterized protein LOC131069044 isoform X2 [Cryptomeria japonica]